MKMVSGGCGSWGCSSSSLLRFAWLLSSDGAAVIGSVDEREWQRFQE